MIMQRADFIAGLSVAGLLLPEAVAYAAIAGLPAERAVVAAIAGCLTYAIWGGSRYAIVSATSSAAAILAATLATLPEADRAASASAAVLLVAVLFGAASLLRLGALTQMISRPVLRGFAFGVAVTIILRQLPAALGVAASPGPLWVLLRDLTLATWNMWSLGLTLVALVLYGAMRQFRAVPGAFIVLLVGIVASHGFDFSGHSVAMVGAIAPEMIWPGLPELSFAKWSGLLPYVLPLALILFAESWGTVSGLAQGERVVPGRELAALGLANLASGLVKGMPVGAGFSAGVAAQAAGAMGKATGLVAALVLAALVVLAAPQVALLPAPVLAAVVIGTLARALDPAPFMRFWQLRRDFTIAVAAALAVLAFGVLNGMLIAVVVSLVAFLRRLSTPRVVPLGRLPQSRAYVDRTRHPRASQPDHITIWRPSQPLFFGNAGPVLERVGKRVRKGDHALVLSLEDSFDLDSSALDELLALDARLAARGIVLHLARVHDHVRDVLLAADAQGLLARSSYSVDEAVAAAIAG